MSSLKMRYLNASSIPPAVVLAVGLAYAVLAYFLANGPLQDFPNHLARAHIIADLWFNKGAAYSQLFFLKPSLAPYLGGDILLATLDHLLGLEWAARLWIALSILALPTSVWFVLRQMQVARSAALIAVLLSFYPATDYFFVMGFLNYQLATAAALYAFGFFYRAMHVLSVANYFGFVLLTLFAYSLHLSALVFIAALVSACGGLRVVRHELAFARLAVLVAPVYLLLLAHFSVSADARYAEQPSEWAWNVKFARLASPMSRFDKKIEVGLFVVVLACALLSFRRIKAQLLSFPILEPALLAGMLIALYFAMPRVWHGVYDVDNRALPYAFIFLLLSSARAAALASDRSRQYWTAAAATAASLNLLFLGSQMLPQDAAIQRYKTLAARIPLSAAVLPIDTRPSSGHYQPFVHAGSYATVLSGSLIPYLFAGNLFAAQAYFLYIRLPEAPDVFWYVLDTDRPHWNSIRRDYDYLLVTRPWDPERIGVSYREVAGNDVAALLKIEK